jgi:hypothetical protein
MDLNATGGGFRWADLDRAIVSPKISKLTAEMQEAFRKDESQISFEGRKRGNSGYFLPTFLDKQLERTDDWARRKYELYCECVYEQGQCITPEFVRDVFANAITVLIHTRKATIADHLRRQANRTGEQLNQHALNKFARQMDILENDWLKALEAEARALEHTYYSKQLSTPVPGSLPQLRTAIMDCESRLTEVNIEIEAQKHALALASASNGPTSKILQAIRRLSVAKINVEHRRSECEQALMELRQASHDAVRAGRRKRAPRSRPPCFETAVALFTKKPNLSLIQFCRDMDSNAEKFRSALKYRPPESWRTRTFYEQYRKRANTVSRFVSTVRSEITRRSKGN